MGIEEQIARLQERKNNLLKRNAVTKTEYTNSKSVENRIIRR